MPLLGRLPTCRAAKSLFSFGSPVPHITYVRARQQGGIACQHAEAVAAAAAAAAVELECSTSLQGHRRAPQRVRRSSQQPANSNSSGAERLAVPDVWPGLAGWRAQGLDSRRLWSQQGPQAPDDGPPSTPGAATLLECGLQVLRGAVGSRGPFLADLVLRL
jgi:hypothetical protein